MLSGAVMNEGMRKALVLSTQYYSVSARYTDSIESVSRFLYIL